MTDDFDELASAYLDGQVSDSEADRVEADPDLQARVSELAALSDAVRLCEGDLAIVPKGAAQVLSDFLKERDLPFHLFVGPSDVRTTKSSRYHDLHAASA